MDLALDLVCPGLRTRVERALRRAARFSGKRSTCARGGCSMKCTRWRARTAGASDRSSSCPRRAAAPTWNGCWRERPVATSGRHRRSGRRRNGAPRIRSAMSVHAQVPVSLPQDNEARWRDRHLFMKRNGCAHRSGRPQALRSWIRWANSPQSFDLLRPLVSRHPWQTWRGRSNRTRIPAPASRQPPHRQASHDFIEQARNSCSRKRRSRAFAPVISACRAAVAGGDSRAERLAGRTNRSPRAHRPH